MQRSGMTTGIASALGLLLIVLLSAGAIAEETVLLEENFNELILGPNIQEALKGDAVWTNIPPEGWTIENDIQKGGMPEWEGWAFADAVWWTNMAGDQERSKFTTVGDFKADAVIAVADPDEWDDAGPGDGKGTYNTALSTPPIPIAGMMKENAIQLIFDSSWRPEDTQNAAVSVTFDKGAPIDILIMTSQGGGTAWEEPIAGVEDLKPDGTQVNETITLDIPNPAGAKTMVITWRMFDAKNDWWWAIDNIRVVTDFFAVSPSGKLATLWGAVKQP